MTKEEAKLVLDNARPQTKEIDRQFYDDEDLNNALDIAIKVLEQQPSEDVINLVNEQEKWLSTAGYNAYNVDIAFKSIVKAIQNVHITTSDDCVSRKAVLDLAETIQTDDYSGNEILDVIDVDDVKALPSVTPTHGKCKDCKNWNENENDKRIGICDEFSSTRDTHYTTERFYCEGYEKRGNENE